MPASSIDQLRAEFRAIATTVVPEASALAEPEWRTLEAIVEHAIVARPERMQRQLALFIRLLDLAALVRYGRRLPALDFDRRLAVLLRFERAPLLLFRRGIWGLRTLIFMGYYARPEAGAEIGYAASPNGWAARGGTGTGIPMRPPNVWVEPGR